MQSPRFIVAIFALAASHAAALPQSTIGETLSTTQNSGPTIISGDKMGTAAFINEQGSTVIAYQANDTSIHLLRGSGTPTDTTSYKDSTILAPRLARNDTPLALAVEWAAAEYGSGTIPIPYNVVSPPPP